MAPTSNTASLALGRIDSRNDQAIPYAYNNSTNLLYTQNLGDGQLNGTRLTLPAGERSPSRCAIAARHCRTTTTRR